MLRNKLGYISKNIFLRISVCNLNMAVTKSIFLVISLYIIESRLFVFCHAIFLLRIRKDLESFGKKEREKTQFLLCTNDIDLSKCLSLADETLVLNLNNINVQV